MARGQYSPRNDPAKHYATSIKYKDFPGLPEDQRGLIRIFYSRVNEDGHHELETARGDVVYNTARDLYDVSKSSFSDLKQNGNLTDMEILTILALQNGLHSGKGLHEKVCQILEDWKRDGDFEIRRDIKRAADILFPPMELK